MIRESASKARRFDVVGYRSFEAMIYEGSEEERRWLKRLANTIENLDISRADKFDARVELLNSARLATAQIVIALSMAEKRRNPIPAKTLALARKMLEEHERVI